MAGALVCGTRPHIDKTTLFDSLRASQQFESTHTVREPFCCSDGGWRMVGSA